MEALGYERFAVQGGDWGSVIAARMACDAPERVAALHLNSAGVLPMPGTLDQPPMSEAEIALGEAGELAEEEGFHLFVQGGGPDALAVGLEDSPVGLAAWLVDKYRRWSDCDGEVERRFSKDEVCDLLTLYWATGTIASRFASTRPRRATAGAGPGDRSPSPRRPRTSRPRSSARRAPGAERQLSDLRR